MASETPEPIDVCAEGDLVRLRAPTCTLTPDAADALADQLRAAAEAARAAHGRPTGERPKPPFPPSELVSPRGGA
jgi:hypothetical protein